MNCDNICNYITSISISTAAHTVAALVLKSPIGTSGAALYGTLGAAIGIPIGYGTRYIITRLWDEEVLSMVGVNISSAMEAFYAGGVASWKITDAIVEKQFSYVHSLALSGTALLGIGILLGIKKGASWCSSQWRNRTVVPVQPRGEVLEVSETV